MNNLKIKKETFEKSLKTIYNDLNIEFSGKNLNEQVFSFIGKKKHLSSVGDEIEKIRDFIKEL